MNTPMAQAAEPTTVVNHLNTCQSPTMAYCQERAEFWITLPETGMNTPAADLMVCEFHASELRIDCNAEIIDIVR